MATSSYQYNIALTQAINRVKAKPKFLRSIFSNHEQLTVPDLAMDVITGSSGMAPLVMTGGRGKVIDGRSQTFETIAVPEIAPLIHKNIAREISKRRAGQAIAIMPGQEGIIKNYPQLIEADAMEDIRRAVDEREEWYCAQALTGTITYSANDLNFTVTFTFPSGHNVTLAGTDKFDNAACDPVALFRAWQKVMVNTTGRPANLCIMSNASAIYFMSNAIVIDRMKWTMGRNYSMSLGGPIDENGCETICENFEGCKIVVYHGQYAADGTGTATDFITTKYLYMLNTDAQYWKSYNCAVCIGEQVYAVPIFMGKYTNDNEDADVTYFAKSAFMPVCTWYGNLIQVATH